MTPYEFSAKWVDALQEPFPLTLSKQELVSMIEHAIEAHNGEPNEKPVRT